MITLFQKQCIAIDTNNIIALCLSSILLGKLIVWTVITVKEKKVFHIQLGERAKRAREQAHLTQEQLAERIEVSPQYISDMERGVVGISVQTLCRLCAALGVSSDTILFGVQADGAAAIAQRCAALPKEQLALLSEMVDCFLRALRQ